MNAELRIPEASKLERRIHCITKEMESLQKLLAMQGNETPPDLENMRALKVGGSSNGDVILALLPKTCTPYEADQVKQTAASGDLLALVEIVTEFGGTMAIAREQ